MKKTLRSRAEAQERGWLKGEIPWGETVEVSEDGSSYLCVNKPSIGRVLRDRFEGEEFITLSWLPWWYVAEAVYMTDLDSPRISVTERPGHVYRRFIPRQFEWTICLGTAIIDKWRLE